MSNLCFDFPAGTYVRFKTSHRSFYSFPGYVCLRKYVWLWRPLWSILRLFASFSHHEALWGVTFDGKSLSQAPTEHHLPEGGNSFHSAEQAKQTLPKVWSPQVSRGHGTVRSFHRSHQRCDTDNRQMKITLVTWQCLHALMESRNVWVNAEKGTNPSSSLLNSRMTS